MLWLDHVVRIVPDFETAERRLRDRYGLEPAYWVGYPGSAVLSRLYVIGQGGIELLGLPEAARAADHVFDRWVKDASRSGERWLGTAVATDELDLHARRLGVKPIPMSARTSDRVRLDWRLLGDPFTNAVPLPFFIEWGSDAEPYPRDHARLNPGFAGIKRVEATGDAARVQTHLGGPVDFLSVGVGDPGIQAVILDGRHGDVRVE